MSNRMDAYLRGILAERERCAKLVEGNVYKEHYREWPGVVDGNRAADSEIVKHCKALAVAIRCEPRFADEQSKDAKP